MSTGLDPSEGYEGESVPPFSSSAGGLLAIFNPPCLVSALPDLCLHLYLAFSLCAYLWSNFPFL